MQVEWYGQSAFRLTDGATTVLIDPFADMTPMLDRGMRWDYPAIADVKADVLLVTTSTSTTTALGPSVATRARCARPPGAWTRRSARC